MSEIVFGATDMVFHAIDLFKIIRIAETYGRDAENADIQVAVDELRMSRWATSVGLKETVEVSWSDLFPDQGEAQLVRRAVGNVTQCIEDAVHEVTKHSNGRKAAAESPQGKKLRDQVIRYFSGLRDATKATVAKTAWALFSREELETLLVKIDRNLLILESFEKGRVERERLAAEEVPSTTEERTALLEACSRDGALTRALKESARSKGPTICQELRMFSMPQSPPPTEDSRWPHGKVT